MPLWNPVTANSYATGVLWTPDLSLTLMGRDFANFFTAWSWALTTVGASSGADAKAADIGVGFPDSWDADSVYPVVLRLSLNITLTFTATDAFSDSCDVWLVYGSTVGTRVTVNASKLAGGVVTSVAACTIDFTQGSLPTGPVIVELWSNWQQGADTLDLSRAITAGPTSWYGFVIV